MLHWPFAWVCKAHQHPALFENKDITPKVRWLTSFSPFSSIFTNWGQISHAPNPSRLIFFAISAISTPVKAAPSVGAALVVPSCLLAPFLFFGPRPHSGPGTGTLKWWNDDPSPDKMTKDYNKKQKKGKLWYTQQQWVLMKVYPLVI